MQTSWVPKTYGESSGTPSVREHFKACNISKHVCQFLTCFVGSSSRSSTNEPAQNPEEIEGTTRSTESADIREPVREPEHRNIIDGRGTAQGIEHAITPTDTTQGIDDTAMIDVNSITPADTSEPTQGSEDIDMLGFGGTAQSIENPDPGEPVQDPEDTAMLDIRGPTQSKIGL